MPDRSATRSEAVGSRPRVVVFSSLFPNASAPMAGIFIKERLFRVRDDYDLVVVAPQAWSPIDGLVRRVRSTFRPMGVSYEVMDGVPVHRPRFLSFPGVLKSLDGWTMALGCLPLLRRLDSQGRIALIDSHFVYPDGFAATWLARRLRIPSTITIRGSKDEWLIGTSRERLLRRALDRASRIFAVSAALKQAVATKLGQPDAKTVVIGNGIDLERFTPVDRLEARARLGLPANAPVIVGVGGLVERKGFHRLIALLPSLEERVPGVQLLIVGGGTTQEDMSGRLRALASELGVERAVHFCGPQPPEGLKWFYGAADVFALATAHEGWANVFLEAMACGLPVVTTRVGGNAEVVASESVGTLVPFWEPDACVDALVDALVRDWNRTAIRQYAEQHSWDARIRILKREFAALASAAPE